MVLINLVLSALPSYQMVSIKQPTWVIKKIDKLRRSFLWSGSDSPAGAKNLVAWQKVCAPKDYGGLGIPDLARHGRAFRARWLFSAWDGANKELFSHFAKDKATLALFHAATNFHLGDGSKCSFWNDPWLLDQPLAEHLPALFHHSRARGNCVKTALHNHCWIRNIKREPSHEVLLQFIKLWNYTQNISLTDMPDSISWKLESSGRYSAASAYHFQFFGRISSLESAIIWRIQIPAKVKIFSWTVALQRSLTADRLTLKGIPANPICQMCRTSPETANHLFARLLLCLPICSYDKPRSIFTVCLTSLIILSLNGGLMKPSAALPACFVSDLVPLSCLDGGTSGSSAIRGFSIPNPSLSASSVS